MSAFAQKSSHQRCRGRVVFHEEDATTTNPICGRLFLVGGEINIVDRRKGEGKRSALTDAGAFRLQDTAVHFCQRARNRQSQA